MSEQKQLLKRKKPGAPLAHHPEMESLNYDSCDNWITRKELRSWTKKKFRRRRIIQWIVTFVIGVTTGFTAFLIDMGVTTLSSVKFYFSDGYFDNGQLGASIGVLLAFSLAYAAVAGYLVSFIEGVAGGSGIPEIKCYLNGIKIPRVVRLKTLFCKASGVLFSVSAGLAVGKEGPMIHSGAAIAAGVSQGQSSSLPFFKTNFLKAFRNDQAKRDFVSGGAAAGTIDDGVWGQLSEPGLVNFGSFNDQDQPGYTIYQIPFFLLLGVFGGLVGSFFNALNKQITLFRFKFIKGHHFRQFIEVLIVAGTTALVASLCSSYAYNCVELEDDSALLSDYQFNCPTGEFNDMGALYFTNQEDAIKHLFHSKVTFTWQTLVIFFVSYYLLACWTYGISVASGLFVPSLLIGCAYGRLFGQLLSDWLPDVVGIDPGTFALVGAASMLGGVVRMTISLTVILMESTNDITYGLPIMLTLMVAKWVGDCFNEGLYDIHIELQKIPFLHWEPPLLMRKFYAKNVMSHPVVTLSAIPRVQEIVKVLEETTHNGFPIRDHENRFIGLILRSQLITLLQKKDFRESSSVIQSYYQLASRDDFERNYPRCPSVHNLSIEMDELSMNIDLRPYMNPVPYSVRESSPLSRVFTLFRTMGLRHLVVVDIDNKIIGMITRVNLVHLDEKAVQLNQQIVSDEFDFTINQDRGVSTSTILDIENEVPFS